MNEDISVLLPYVLEAFSFVYGSEYREYISKKLQNTKILLYNDVDGLDDYLSFLKKLNILFNIFIKIFCGLYSTICIFSFT